MSSHPEETQQKPKSRKLKWRIILPLVLALVDLVLIVTDGLFILDPKVVHNLNIVGRIPLTSFGTFKNAKYEVLNNCLYYGGGILLWMILGWLVGLYLDDRKKSSEAANPQ